MALEIGTLTSQTRDFVRQGGVVQSADASQGRGEGQVEWTTRLSFQGQRAGHARRERVRGAGSLHPTEQMDVMMRARPQRLVLPLPSSAVGLSP